MTIDGETARDFDDAVYVERREDGGWHLQVHIADVAHYVRTRTALDNEARLRGTSVYFIDRAVPMLPESLSNGICSLNPREDRLVMSCLMEFDASGRMRDSRMTAGVIRSAERMTYTNVNKVIEGDVEVCSSYCSANDPRVHCGLGAASAIDSVTVRWRDGTRETFGPITVDRIETLRQGTGRPAQ